MAIVFLSSASYAMAQSANPHAEEPIGTVREVYDGALTPDLQVNTFRNIDRLFPTRTIKRIDDLDFFAALCEAVR